ncbi:hypothetical protein HOF65_00660 [bacterium]|nr:hypothetical protein [bacterium]
MYHSTISNTEEYSGSFSQYIIINFLSGILVNACATLSTLLTEDNLAKLK